MVTARLLKNNCIRIYLQYKTKSKIQLQGCDGNLPFLIYIRMRYCWCIVGPAIHYRIHADFGRHVQQFSEFKNTLSKSRSVYRHVFFFMVQKYIADIQKCVPPCSLLHGAARGGQIWSDMCQWSVEVFTHFLSPACQSINQPPQFIDVSLESLLF